MGFGVIHSLSHITDIVTPADTRLIGPPVSPDSGISLEPVYCGEVFTNARGGTSTRDATQYQALLDLPLTIDLEKTSLPMPGRFFLLAQNTHGRGLSNEFIGDTQIVSNIDSNRNIMQVSEYWWEIGVLDERVVVRLGKQDVNTEFLVMDLAEDFIQSSFGVSPSSGLPTYPNATMGALLLIQPSERLRFKVGIWDAFGDGRSWGFSGNDIAFLFGELEYKYALFDGLLPGALDVGAAYASDGELGGLTLPSARGYYVQLEQLLARENPCQEGDTQGFGAFASYFPRFAEFDLPIQVIWSDFVAGIVYKGLLPCRDEDVMGSGVAWAQLNNSGTLQETAIEFFYKAQITPSITLQPDLQYIVSPSGIHRDALAVGIRSQVTL
jgi:porin